VEGESELKYGSDYNIVLNGPEEWLFVVEASTGYGLVG
jgi:hypothetical protein